MKSVPILLMLLSGCAYYPDDCNRKVLHELWVVDDLIEETEENLARGYAYETVETGFNAGFVFCSGTWNTAICAGNDTSYTEQPVAIDPESERRKLDALKQRREALVPAVAECVPA